MPPTIAIIGRPNVGKSTLFNRLIGRRQALVDETPGVTRDRIVGEAEWRGHTLRIIDTGGIDEGNNTLSQAIRSQSLQAMAEADVLCCLFDARDGLTPLDEEIVALVRRMNRPVFFVINKVDTERQLTVVGEFARLGAHQLYPISAEHGRRLDDLLDAIVAAISRVPSPAVSPHASDGRALRVAMIGRPNVGKSSLVNRLVGSPRVVAHELPGTTRDAIDIAITVGGEHYLLIDTAGIRRRARTEGRVEKFSVIKALQTMEQADVVILLADATEGLTHQDRQLAATIVGTYRPLLVAVNKWDLVPKKGSDARVALLRESLHELRRVPLLTISARTGWHCAQLLPQVRRLAAARQRRLKTADLNHLVQEVQQQHHLPSHRSQPVRLYYATQVGVAPPSFLFFANYPAAIPTSYRRYLVKALEEVLDAPGLPIRLMFRKRTR